MIDTQLWHNQRCKINPLQAQIMYNRKFIEVEELKNSLTTEEWEDLQSKLGLDKVK